MPGWPTWRSKLGSRLAVSEISLFDRLSTALRADVRVGYRVTVIDARATYTTRERFPDAAEIIVAWPHRALEQLPPLDASTYVAVLTHDPKFEEPLLPLLLRSEARYVGMIGSRRT